VRIDRSDLADESDNAQMALSTRLAADDPDATSKDQGKAVGGDGPPDSSPAPLDSALYIERAVAYRAAVDAAYRHYDVDHSPTRMEEPERETAVPAMPPTEASGREDFEVPDGTAIAGWAGSPPGKHDARVRDHASDLSVVTEVASGDAYHNAAEITPAIIGNINGFGCQNIRTTADDVQTGARGAASGREFDPETAGGPIQQLDATKATITDEGVHAATAHLLRFTGGGPLEAPEQAMLDRLMSIAAGDMEPTSYDLNFYTHELDEADRYAQLGLGPESGADLGTPEMYDVWNDVHTAALEDYKISGADLFYPGVAP
jgi:hypothetical protein